MGCKMRIQGSDNLWYIVPDLGKKHVVLAELLEDGFFYGKTVAPNEQGELCVEVLGDLDWACEVATYLYIIATMSAGRVN